MTINLNSDGSIYFPTNDGHWISENQRRIAEILADRYPHLQLQWIPPGDRGHQDYAFRVVDFTPGKPPYVVCFAHECDERLLARVFQADNSRGNVLSYLDSHNAALEALRMKRVSEEREEWFRIAHSILRSPKIHYKHGGIDFGKPFGGRYG